MHICKYCKKEYKKENALIKHLTNVHTSEVNYILEERKLKTPELEVEEPLTDSEILAPLFKNNTEEHISFSKEELDILSDVYERNFKQKLNINCKYAVIGAFITLYKKFK